MTTNTNPQPQPIAVCKCGRLLTADDTACPTCKRPATDARPFTPGGVDAVLYR